MAANEHATGARADKKDEARQLAKEAAAELAHGNREEGRFLAEEAKALDPSGAAEALKDEAAKEPAKPGD